MTHPDVQPAFCLRQDEHHHARAGRDDDPRRRHLEAQLRGREPLGLAQLSTRNQVAFTSGIWVMLTQTLVPTQRINDGAYYAHRIPSAQGHLDEPG